MEVRLLKLSVLVLLTKGVICKNRGIWAMDGGRDRQTVMFGSNAKMTVMGAAMATSVGMATALILAGIVNRLNEISRRLEGVEVLADSLDNHLNSLPASLEMIRENISENRGENNRLTAKLERLATTVNSNNSQIKGLVETLHELFSTIEILINHKEQHKVNQEGGGDGDGAGYGGDYPYLRRN